MITVWGLIRCILVWCVCSQNVCKKLIQTSFVVQEFHWMSWNKIVVYLMSGRMWLLPTAIVLPRHVTPRTPTARPTANVTICNIPNGDRPSPLSTGTSLPHTMTVSVILCVVLAYRMTRSGNPECVFLKSA